MAKPKKQKRKQRARLAKWVTVWAGLATISSGILGWVTVFRKPEPIPVVAQVEYKDIDTLTSEIDKLTEAINKNSIAAQSDAEREQLSRSFEQMKRSIRRLLPDIQPGGDPFVLGPNNPVYLISPGGDKMSLSVSTIHPQHGYAYLGIDGSSRQQAYTGREIVFTTKSQNICSVTLMGIDDEQKEITVDYKCEE